MAKEKWITTGMAAVIAIGLLTGCGSKDANADAATNTTKDAASSIQGEQAETQPAAFAEIVLSESPASDFEYKEEDGKNTITYYKGKSTEIAIPAQIDGKDVTAIGDNCFANKEITVVVCPNTLETIGESAFINCYDLAEIYLNEGLQNIKKNAFLYCKSLEHIDIPSTMVCIDDLAFASAGIKEINFLCDSPEWGIGVFNSSKVVEITIPSNLKIMGDSMFANSQLLETVVIEEGVEKIDRQAFSTCKELKKVSIPASVTEIGEMVFDKTNDALVLTVQPGSYAETYAKENGIACVNP